MIHCVNCQGVIEVERVRCPDCGLAYEGRFAHTRLARLGPAHQLLVEQIVLAAGNLKDVAARLDVSYPTLRKRLDTLIASLEQLRSEDEARTRSMLDQVEAGSLTAEEAARLIKEMNGGA